jgi:hypothetical protein
MSNEADTKSDAEKFDAVVRKMMTVSRNELKKREKNWRKRQARKWAKSSPASRASGSKA